jgi:hypothetical protein
VTTHEIGSIVVVVVDPPVELVADSQVLFEPEQSFDCWFE